MFSISANYGSQVEATCSKENNVIQFIEMPEAGQVNSSDFFPCGAWTTIHSISVL